MTATVSAAVALQQRLQKMKPSAQKSWRRQSAKGSMIQALGTTTMRRRRQREMMSMNFQHSGQSPSSLLRVRPLLRARPCELSSSASLVDFGTKPAQKVSRKLIRKSVCTHLNPSWGHAQLFRKLLSQARVRFGVITVHVFEDLELGAGSPFSMLDFVWLVSIHGVRGVSTRKWMFAAKKTRTGRMF